MFLQAIETTNSFWGSSLMFWLLWLGTFLLASALYYFGYGRRYKDLLEDKESMIKKLRPQINLLNNEKEHLTAEKTSLKTSLEELVTKHNGLKSYHDSVQSKYQAATTQFEQANEERQTLLDSYESLEKNLEATEQRYNDSLAKIDQLEAELENIEEGTPRTVNDDSSKLLQQEINQLKSVINNKDAEINKLNISLAAKPKKQIKVIEKPALQKELERKQTALQQEHDTLQSAYAGLQNDYNQLRNAHTTLSNNFQTLEEKSQQQHIVELNTLETSQLQSKLIASEAKYGDLLKLKNQLTQQVKQTEQQVGTYRSTNKELTDKLALVTTKYQTAVAEVEALQSSILTSENDQAEKRGALNQIERMLKEMQLDNDRLKEKNIELSITQKQVQEQLTLAKQELETLKPQLSKIQSIKSEHQGDLQHLKQTIKSQGEELLKAQAQLKAYSELKSVNMALDSNNKNLNTAYLNLQKKYDGFHKDYLTVKSQFQLLRDKYEHLENTSNQLKENKSKTDRTNVELSAELAQLRADKKTVLEEKVLLEKRIKEVEKYLATPQTKSTSSTQTTRLYKNGKTVISDPPDDLKIVEGIGGKIEVLLNNSGIFTWKQLSRTGIGELKRILAASGAQLNLHDPSTWPEQAELAVADKWEQLEKFQQELIGGRRRN